MVELLRWVHGQSAIGTLDVGARCSRCGECVGSMPSVRCVRGAGYFRCGGWGELSAVGAVDVGNEWGGDGLCAGCGLCAREPLSRRSPGGLSQDFFGLRIEREELVLRPCLGCFLSYKERTEVDKSLYLVKNNSCSQPDLIWCGASRSLDAHFFSSDALDSFSDPTSSLSVTCVILL